MRFTTSRTHFQILRTSQLYSIHMINMNEVGLWAAVSLEYTLMSAKTKQNCVTVSILGSLISIITHSMAIQCINIYFIAGTAAGLTQHILSV